MQRVYCQIKETLFVQDLEPAFNVNVGSEKLMLYLSTLVFLLYCYTCTYLLNLGSRPLAFVLTVTFENVCRVYTKRQVLFKNV